VVPLVANLLTVEHLEISVRSLMVLGMLCCGSQTAQQQLAEEAGALQELLALLKQQEDMDCKVSGDCGVDVTCRPASNVVPCCNSSAASCSQLSRANHEYCQEAFGCY
jgi:hypothetical protein